MSPVSADLTQAGQSAGELAGVGPSVGGFPFGGVDRQFRLDRAQQPYFGGDLGGEVSECHRRMIVVELDRSLGAGQPLLGPRGALMIARRLDDHRGQPGLAQPQQRPRVCPPFQDGQVGLAQIAGQRGERHQLPDQVFEADLVLGCLHGQPVAGPYPPVQRGPLGSA